MSITKEKKVKVFIFETKCSLKEIKNREKIRAKDTPFKKVGLKAVGEIFKTINKNSIPGSIPLDTENSDVDKCVDQIWQLVS